MFCHWRDVKLLPSLLILRPVSCRDLSMDERQVRPTIGRFEENFQTRMRASFGKLCRAPRLDHLFILDELNRFSRDVSIPRSKTAANIRLDRCSTPGHCRVIGSGKPRIIKALRAGSDHRGNANRIRCHRLTSAPAATKSRASRSLGFNGCPWQ